MIMKNWIVILTLLMPSAVWAAAKPNIIFMLSDDQGWNGLSVAMHPDVPASRGANYNTPSLEKLAAQGMRFSAAYAPAPVCSPTRISLQTGKSPALLHWTKAAPPETGRKLNEPILIKNIPASETTIGELLRQAGYATAHYGKWHIRGGGPGQHGYDEHDGDTGNEEAFRFKDPNPVDIFGMASKAAAFMEKSQKAGKPFYIQLSWNALHAPGNALKTTLAKYQKLGEGKNMERAAITEDLDTGVGRVLKSIDQLGLAGETYVIYMSDNGAGGGRGALAGGKGDLYEGGIRVPLIIRGPGVKANSWCHVRTVGYDMLPTFCEWAGISASALPKGIEGGSFAAALANAGVGSIKRPREELVFHFPHYQGDAPHSAIYMGNLKLIRFYEDNKTVLFDLSRDIGEKNDLSKQMPAEAARLGKKLQDYLVAVHAQMPTPNPQYDPKRAVTQPKKGKKNG
jgi:arylsulfatase A-like enzyme